MTKLSIQPFDRLDQLHESAAAAFCDLVSRTLQQSDVVRISLSGGSTPKRLYELLSERDLPWEQIHWFWGDERNVPLDDADSNARMVREALLDRVGAPSTHVHPVPVDGGEPAAVAAAYERTLQEHFPDDDFPRWDLALLGMGDDAHTASLFPETAALEERERWFVENWVEKLSTFRYTLTAPAINSAKQSWFLISGQGKREALQSVLGETADHRHYPSQLIDPTGWFVTKDAWPGH